MKITWSEVWNRALLGTLSSETSDIAFNEFGAICAVAPHLVGGGGGHTVFFLW
jgi:hypothetical protein